mmetsp:Transcript_25837/g.83671  ORF Transcript_25837/g.83671 Transcript_25837/m.83671 type:complete len:236 (-) Transcript_25837:412-1119(-)
MLRAVLGVHFNRNNALFLRLVLDEPLHPSLLELHEGRALHHRRLLDGGLGDGTLLRRCRNLAIFFVFRAPSLHILRHLLQPRRRHSPQRRLQVTQSSASGSRLRSRSSGGRSGRLRRRRSKSPSVGLDIASLGIEGDAGHVVLLDVGHELRHQFLEGIAIGNMLRFGLLVFDADLVRPEILPTHKVLNKIFRRGLDHEPRAAPEAFRHGLLVALPVSPRYVLRRFGRGFLTRLQH